MMLTNDYVFKRIFGRVGNEEITKEIITRILNKEIHKVELVDNPIFEEDLKEDKVGVFKVRAKLDDYQMCNIEMHTVPNNNIEKRIMFYWNKLYLSGLNLAEDYNYNNLSKTIAILMVNFDIDIMKAIPNYHTTWEIREDEFSKIILTNVLELHIIELPKLMRQYNENQISKNDELSIWLRFILNPDQIKEKDIVKTKG